MRRLVMAIPLLLSIAALCAPSGSSQSNSVAPAEISADLGTCSALITVSGSDLKPVYAAKMTTRIRYGPFGVKKLDLEAFTGADGTLKIKNLPDELKKPMYIYVGKDGKQEMVEFRPDLRCHATFTVELR